MFKSITFKTPKYQPVKVANAILLSLTLAACGGSGSGSGSESPPLESGQVGDGRLAMLTEQVRHNANLPAIAAISVQNGQIMEQISIGLRDQSGINNVAETDFWHIGSITKSMTALVAARLVASKQLTWDTRVADLFPELEGQISPQFFQASLAHFLSHTSGLGPELPGYDSYYNHPDALVQQRVSFLQQSLNRLPMHDTGEFEYSNAGYVVAAAMLERASNLPWEQLLQQQLLDPLGMPNTFVGEPDPEGQNAQPVGHQWIESGWQPLSPDEIRAAIPDAFAPAGNVYLNLTDMATYMLAHIAAFTGENIPGYLDANETAPLYQTQPNSSYAMGWAVTNAEIEHSGSNTRWFAEVLINKEQEMGVFVVTNADSLSASTEVARLKRLLAERMTNSQGQGISTTP